MSESRPSADAQAYAFLSRSPRGSSKSPEEASGTHALSGKVGYVALSDLNFLFVFCPAWKPASKEVDLSSQS